MSADQIPEQVYLDAAQASDGVLFPHRPISSDATVSQSKHPGFRAAVASAYRAGQAAAPDGPRTWALPDEPGPEVTRVRDRDGDLWHHTAKGWQMDPDPIFVGDTWAQVLQNAPLTDATPAGGQV